jgi:hypothetical protein
MKLAFVILSVLVGLCVAFAPPLKLGAAASAPPRVPRLIGQALKVPPGWPIAAFQYAPDVQGPWRTAFVLTNGPRPVVLFDVSDQRQMFYRFLPGPPVPPFPE